MKDFTREFDKIKALIVSGDPFAFSRFSDGEVTVLQNNVVVLAKDHFIQGDLHGDDVKHGGSYLPEEQKEFRPDKHDSFQKKLVEAFKHRQYNYFKGIPPQNASYGDCSWKFCTELYGEGDDQHLSFSNLLHRHIYIHHDIFISRQNFQTRKGIYSREFQVRKERIY